MPFALIVHALRRRLPAAVMFPLVGFGCMSASGQDGGRERSPEAVLGKVWQWEALVSPVERIEVPTPQRYWFRLMPDGKMTAQFDCNRGGGSYRIEPGKLGFGPLISSRMGCSSGSLGERFGRDLGQIAGFFLEQGKLYLELPVGGGTLRFRPAGSPPANGR